MEKTLTPFQKVALSKISDKQYSLLHGITGSGKTEVYIRAVNEVVSKGEQAIVLVPEISLTPQTIARFSKYFKIAVIHSHLSKAQKSLEWKRILDNEVEVVVGARSALFAPVKKLGLIVLDEEHDSSFKQDSHPRYHAVEVAIHRAKFTGAKLVLGSATPSLESYHLFSNRADFQVIDMPERVDKLSLPSIQIVDLRKELIAGNKGVISYCLRKEIKKSLSKGLQVILLQNRRGFSTFLLCRECGFVVECPNCSVALTFHKKTNSLCCHYCGYRVSLSSLCPRCHSKYFRFFGTGTQKVENELGAMFPDTPIFRMDRDTTRRKGSYERILTDFAKTKSSILLGTQMIAKGHDFPNVNLVGVISADTALNFPDFRAAERTFQLLTQVAGRAGRSPLTKESIVIIQSYNPEHYAINTIVNGNYKDFYDKELSFRKELDYPPYSQLILVTISSKNKKVASEIIPGLIPAPIFKLRGLYRFQKLFKKNKKNLEAIEKLVSVSISGVSIDIDVDPFSFT